MGMRKIKLERKRKKKKRMKKKKRYRQSNQHRKMKLQRGNEERARCMGVSEGTTGKSADVFCVGLNVLSVSFCNERCGWERGTKEKIEEIIKNIGDKGGKKMTKKRNTRLNPLSK